jgi:hypothetical protein
MDLSLDTLNLGDGTRLGEVPSLQGLDLSTMRDGMPVRGKARQYVRFYWREVPEIYATEVEIVPLGMTGTTTTNVKKTGMRTIKKEMVHIVTPGDKNEYDDVVTDYHRSEYWPQYQAFRNGKGIPLGTPLDEVEYLPPAIVHELKLKSVHTQEQLADASDLLCGLIPDGYMYREYARTANEANLNNKSLSKVNALTSKVEELTKQLERLSAGASEVEESPRPRVAKSKGE